MDKRYLVASALAAAFVAPSLISAQAPVMPPKRFHRRKMLRRRQGRPERLRLDRQQLVRRHVEGGRRSRRLDLRSGRLLRPDRRWQRNSGNPGLVGGEDVAVTNTSNHLVPHAAGVGLRLPHLAEVTATLPAVGWLKIHPENFLANPHATEMLMELSRHYPISVHTVGISIGSVEGIDQTHLARLRALVDAVDPIAVSGHLAWSTHEGAYLNDLLPLPYDEATLRLLATHLDEVQEGLGRPYVVENPSSYVALAASTMPELEFLNELVHRTGCQLLCDVSNVFLSGHNMGYDP